MVQLEGKMVHRKEIIYNYNLIADISTCLRVKKYAVPEFLLNFFFSGV